MFLILIYISLFVLKIVNPLQELVSVRAKEKVFRSKKCSTVSERYSPFSIGSTAPTVNVMEKLVCRL